MTSSGGRTGAWALAATLAGVAILGPVLGGGSATPSYAPSAAQLLPPGSAIEELSLEGGGLLRGRRIEVAPDSAVHILSESGWRTIGGVRAAEEPRRRRVWLGTDHQGRDLLALALQGARTSLTVAALAALVAVSVGTGVGLASVLGGPALCAGLHLLADAALGIPRLLLLLVLAVSFEGSTAGVAVAIGLASWMDTARLVEADARRIARGGFFAAARAAGAGRPRLAVRHLAPNVVPVLFAVVPLSAAEAVLLEATLSYLGVSPGGVSWGLMVADGQRALPGGWWLVVFPGSLVCLAALALNDLARGLGPARDG